MPGVDRIMLSKENLHNFLNILCKDNLLKYKSSGTQKVFIPKGKGTDLRPLEILTIEDIIIQTLFVQIIEPIIDPHADSFSYGFRKGRDVHQAIGELSRILNVTPYLRGDKIDTRKYFWHTRYILQIDIKGFFDNVDHQYLLNNYPIPKKFRKVFES